ncbi:TetR/AcrR family transcriptional regulator [Herbaspirillum rubrisubalbicans]|uniref:TetR/AcrR family transcriptional regulator n=1 Tax=Herbaspirillum rubrisubalbicans TaxID=80842 RepID=A0AAD0U8H6_9BURK|nr:TetR/AcrR family transcriptional regulator [Herbaspirillum rubrisubalbicans]AYR25333.1 TetR/AcrR family transcriptional regulator [Herbaspirillum rubrisubalbicans]
MDSSDDASLTSRLLATTEKLIYSGGIHATGMDAIVKESGVARRSIYRLYANKEELVAAALLARDQRWMSWFVGATSQTSAPMARLESIFPALRQWFESEDFHGCAFINAAGELGKTHPDIGAVSALHKQRLRSYLRELTSASGLANPDEVANYFLILIDGATAVAMVTGDASAADSAGRAAALLLSTLPQEAGSSSPTR